MSDDREAFWASIPEQVRHPVRDQILEALRWIDGPISAVGLVDVFDGDLTMWEVAHHLAALDRLDVAKPVQIDRNEGRRPHDSFDVPYRLVERGR